jgi:O-antigen ligase
MDAHKQHWHEWGFPGEYITHTHSTPIQLAMERGLPALGCYVWLMLALGWWLWRRYKDEQNPLSFGALAALCGFSLSSLVNYNFGDSEVVLLLLFMVAFSVQKKRDEQPSLLPITHPEKPDENAQ